MSVIALALLGIAFLAGISAGVGAIVIDYNRVQALNWWMTSMGLLMAFFAASMIWLGWWMINA